MEFYPISQTVFVKSTGKSLFLLKLGIILLLEDYVRRQRDYDREENIIFSSKAVQQ